MTKAKKRQYQRRYNAKRKIRERLDAIARETEGAISNWYQESRVATKEIYGDDYELFIKCLAATSPNCALKANITLARKAYIQIKETGQVDKNSFTKTHYKGLQAVINGGIPNGRKVRMFTKALLGEQDAVVVDVWITRAAGINRKAPYDWEYDIIEEEIVAQAGKYNRTPAEHQAAIWGKIRGASDSYATHMLQLRLF